MNKVRKFLIKKLAQGLPVVINCQINTRGYTPIIAQNNPRDGMVEYCIFGDFGESALIADKQDSIMSDAELNEILEPTQAKYYTGEVAEYTALRLWGLGHDD